MAYELPFILYKNVLADGVVTVTSEAAGFPKENMSDWTTWTYWKATSAANQNIDIDKAAAGIAVDTLAILSHNLGSAGDSIGTVITVLEDDNPSFSSPVTMGTVALTDDKPFYLDLSSGTQRYNRIQIENLDVVPFIGVLALGARMTMPVGPEFSFDPDRQKVMSAQFVSYIGNFIGSSVKFPNRTLTVPFKRIAQTFVASDLLPFVEDHYGAMIPFFFVPDPGDVFGTGKIYYLTAPDNPDLSVPVYSQDTRFRNWTLVATGVRQSTFR